MQEEYQESLTTSATRDVSREVTRTVEGASIEALVTINNAGQIPFTVNNLQLTGLLQDPFDRRSFLPVATLLPASVLSGGGDLAVTLGPFIPERGPFVFKNQEVFPSLIEDLMKNPRGILFTVANFDIQDEEGRNFAFISEDVNDLTAGLIIDYGNGSVDRFRVATYGGLDSQRVLGGSCTDDPDVMCQDDDDCGTSGTCVPRKVGGFGESGRPLGVPMAYALQDILGLKKNEAPNAITVGDNGCGETWAVGDDIQVAAPLCFAVPIGGLIIEAGPNGTLDSIPVGDDVKSPNGNSILDGGDGCAHTRASRDDVQVVQGGCQDAFPDGVMVLPGPNGTVDTVPEGDDRNMTVTGYGTELVGACDGNTTKQITGGQNGLLDTSPAGDDVIVGSLIRAGMNTVLETSPEDDDVLQGPGMACEDNDDCPGPGNCRSMERLARVKGVENVPAEKRFWIILTNVSIPPGTDFDEVVLQAGQVFSLAYVQDRDDDGLIAQEEFLYGSSDRDDNSDGCPLGDGAAGCDPLTFDFDTVLDFEEVKKGWTVAIAGGRSYSAYPNPIQPDSDTDGLFDDEELFLSTDPAKRDTDDDEISDFREVTGYDILRRDGFRIRHVAPYQSAFIAPGPDDVLDTTAVGDDERTRHADDRDIITPGNNGELDSIPDNDDLLEASTLILDGGNGTPESTASGDDVQVGPSPTSTATVTVTFLDYAANGNACDGAQTGEFDFNLRVRKNVETIVASLVQEGVPIQPLLTYDFDGAIFAGPNGRADTAKSGDDVQVTNVGASATAGVVIRPGANGILDTTTLGGDDVFVDFGTGDNVVTLPLDPGDTLTFSGTVREVELLCDSQTRKGVMEPGEVIIDAGNNRADTTAAGDDVQEVSLGATVTAGRVIISPGPNGVLNTVPAVGDVRPAGNGFADTRATGDDEQVIPFFDTVSPGDFIVLCGTDGEPAMGLVPATPGICEAAIVRTVLGDGTADTLAASTDRQIIARGSPVMVGQAVVGAGANGTIDTVPGSAHEEIEEARSPIACAPVITHASGAGNGIAETSAREDDIQVIPVGDPASPDAVIIDPGPDNIIDSNVATEVVVRNVAGIVTTEAEMDDVQIHDVGDTVAANTIVVAPGPNGVIDSEPVGDEEITPADDRLVAAHTPSNLNCSTCPLGSCVTDCGSCATGLCTGDDVVLVRSAGSACDDGICPCGECTNGPFVEWLLPSRTYTVSQLKADTDGIIEVAFDDGTGCFQNAVLRVRVDVSAGVDIAPGAVVVRPGENGVLDTVPGGDDFVGASHLTVFATDPLDRDTDGDTLLDGAEVVLGANPNDAADAAKFRDNDLDGLANIEESQGWFIGVADEDGLRCRRADGSFIAVEDQFDPPASCVVVRSDPFEPDTDFDGLPDLLEMIIRSDPTGVDTDDDVLLDLDEFDPASEFSVQIRAFREFQRRCLDAGRCGFTPVEEPHGTSVVLADTDADDRDDRNELFEGWVILPCVGSSQLPFEVFSSPLSQDADRDGVLDGDEQTNGTDPADPDTDADGIADGVDPVPTGCGQIVTVSFDNYRTTSDCDGSGENGEWHFEFSIYRGAQGGQLLGAFTQLNGDLDDNRTHTFSANSTRFTLRPGESFRIEAKLWEDDASSGDEIWNLRRVITFDQVPNGPVQYGPLPTDSYNDGCFNGHQLTVNITSTGA
jgi:hypothetical protein